MYAIDLVSTVGELELELGQTQNESESYSLRGMSVISYRIPVQLSNAPGGGVGA